MKNSEFGYSFDCEKCEDCGGKCCIGESGYIWINDEEIRALSAYLGMDPENFKKDFCLKVGIRFSLKEKVYNTGKACVFFDEKNKNCSIYDFRPKQCRTFPFWDYFKKHFDELERECIGIKRSLF